VQIITLLHLVLALQLRFVDSRHGFAPVKISQTEFQTRQRAGKLQPPRGQKIGLTANRLAVYYIVALCGAVHKRLQPSPTIAWA
jgi:hypothetical protein